MNAWRRVLPILLASWLLGSCALPATPLLLVDGELPDRLSDWQMLLLRDGQLQVVDAAVPYELNTPLFSDYALKLRTLWVPPDQHIRLVDGLPNGVPNEPGALQFPVGTVLTKTFYYPKPGILFDDAAAIDGRVDLNKVRLLETRVLVHQQDGWRAVAYVWDDDQREAFIARGGSLLRPEFTHPLRQRRLRTDYLVPDQNQCANCHARNHSTKRLQPLGPRLDNLAAVPAREHTDAQSEQTRPATQIDAWRARGWLATDSDNTSANTPPPLARWNDVDASLGARAIAYLDVNCGHCHNAYGAADTSGLYLDRSSLERAPQGVCKSPVAAGKGAGQLAYDLVPGNASESILLFRMESTDPSVMMPELGRSLADIEGVRLIRDWIDSLSGSCPTPTSRARNPTGP